MCPALCYMTGIKQRIRQVYSLPYRAYVLLISHFSKRRGK